MAEERDARNWVISAGAIAVLLGGAWFSQSPLKSFRPPVVNQEAALKDDTIHARLWRDPLYIAEQDFQKAVAEPPLSASDLVRYFARLQIPLKAPPTTISPSSSDLFRGAVHTANYDGNSYVFMVMMDGNPYQEGTESRIRTRYAVISALGRACYAPQEDSHIGYFGWNVNDRPIVSGERPSTIVAYEWYQRRHIQRCSLNDPGRILVLWVKESDFDPHLLKNILNFANVARQAGKVKIIGPVHSESLRRMMDEKPDPGPAYELYSPWVTVDSRLFSRDQACTPQEITCGPKPEDSPKTFIADRLAARGLTWMPTIGSDIKLSDAVVKELRNRGIRQENGDLVVLVNEWDTFYGRMIPIEFAIAALSLREDESNRSLDEDRKIAMAVGLDAWRPDGELAWLHRYSYLRGLDGEVVSVAEKDGGKDKRQEEFPKSSHGSDLQRIDVAEYERPTGEPQLDYVRRLAKRIAENRKIKAIGVLGSDPYDKLLILQALRREIPSAVYFTFELDARLLHPTQEDWTKNLIIASHYGLALNRAVQGDIPPFRDSYQTSVCRAVLMATGYLWQIDSLVKTADGDSFPLGDSPFLYEVGRTEEVDISFDKSASIRRDLPSSPWRTLQVHDGITWIFIIAGIVAVLAVLSIACHKTAAWPASVGLLALVGMLYVFLWISQMPGEEPFFLLEGISVWPTEIVRVLAISLCWILIFKSQYGQYLILHRLGDEFLGVQSSGPGSFSSWIRSRCEHILFSLRHILTSITATFWPCPIQHETKSDDLRKLWSKHNDFSMRWFAWTWTQIALFAFLGVIFINCVFVEPNRPLRGTLTSAIDERILHAMIFSFVSLLFFTVHAIRVALNLVENVKARVTADHSKELGLLVRNSRLSPWLLHRWQLIQFVAVRTEIVSTFILNPLLVMFLLFVGRNRFFDNWVFTPGLLFIYVLSMVYIVTYAYILEAEVGRLRNVVLAQLDNRRMTRLSPDAPDDSDDILHVIEIIKAETRGAFGSWYQRPLWRTILYPVGGMSLVTLLDALATGKLL